MPSTSTHIDVVEQIDLPPITPGRGWYAVGSVVIGVGLVAGFFLLASGAFGYLRDLGDLVRIPVPGEAEAPLEAGVITIYHEPDGGPVVGPPALAVEVLDPAGAPVELRPPGSPDQYVVEGRRGFAVAAFDAAEPGTYQVTVGAGATGELVVGPSPRERLATLGTAGLLVAAVALVVGVAILVVTRRRRGRSTAARLAHQQANPVITRLP